MLGRIFEAYGLNTPESKTTLGQRDEVMQKWTVGAEWTKYWRSLDNQWRWIQRVDDIRCKFRKIDPTKFNGSKSGTYHSWRKHYYKTITKR